MKSLHLSRVCLRRSTTVAFGNSRSVRPSRAGVFSRRRSTKIPAHKAETATTEKQELLDPTAPAVMSAEEIMSVLPHRYPFLLVDRVTQMEEKMIVGFKNITMNDNFFTGHFPDRPIMPGVLQIEALAQLAGILMLKEMDEAARQNFFFGGVENCRFRKPVVPGDTLMMKVDITKKNLRFGVVKAHGEAYVNGETVCDADLTLVVVKGT